MLRYIGVICIFFFAFYAIYSYERYQRMKALQGDAFLSLLQFILCEMRGLGRPMGECLAEFKSEALERCGFLPALRESGAPEASYRRLEAGLCLPPELSPILANVFARLGRTSRMEEQRHLAAEIARAEAVLFREKELQKGRLRLCRTLATAGAMGLVILLL